MLIPVAGSLVKVTMMGISFHLSPLMHFVPFVWLRINLKSSAWPNCLAAVIMVVPYIWSTKPVAISSFFKSCFLVNELTVPVGDINCCCQLLFSCLQLSIICTVLVTVIFFDRVMLSSNSGSEWYVFYFYEQSKSSLKIYWEDGLTTAEFFFDIDQIDFVAKKDGLGCGSFLPLLLKCWYLYFSPHHLKYWYLFYSVGTFCIHDTCIPDEAFELGRLAEQIWASLQKVQFILKFISSKCV